MLPRMLRPLLLAALAVAALAAIPASASAASCKLPADGKGFGPTYLLSLKTKRVSCSTGKAVVKAWHACSTAKSLKGHCRKRVLGFRCSERRGAAIPTQFDAKATCRKGGGPRRLRLHPVHLKSAAIARWTASAASCAPAALRWMPSGLAHDRLATVDVHAHPVAPAGGEQVREVEHAHLAAVRLAPPRRPRR